VFETLREGPRSVGDLARGLPVSRPAVSQHLRVLKQAGLVRERREGTRNFYRVDGDGLAELRAYFEGFWDETLAAFKAAAESEGGEMSQMTDELAVRKSIVVACPVEHAFRIFTEQMGDWWPFEGHSLFDEKAETVVFEPRAGGRVYERTADGEEGLWGTLIGWNPPRGFRMTWHPGRDEETAQELELRFSAEGEGTRVELVHTGWERLGDRMAEIGGHYDEGWDVVLGHYVDAAGKAA
jgi:DNA-binding transcriptional ArsR family regulator/uncharacterized protein YndB with AHSA1/START domain